MSKGKRIATIAGLGVAVVIGLVAMEWDRIAAWYRFHQMFESVGTMACPSTGTGYPGL